MKENLPKAMIFKLICCNNTFKNLELTPNLETIPFRFIVSERTLEEGPNANLVTPLVAQGNNENRTISAFIMYP